MTTNEAATAPADQGDAYELDGNTLGENPGDEGLPGINAFSDGRPNLNSEDPNVVNGDVDAPDNLRTRVSRERPDVDDLDPAADRDTALEQAEAGLDPTDSDVVIAPEEAALHVET